MTGEAFGKTGSTGLIEYAHKFVPTDTIYSREDLRKAPEEDVKPTDLSRRRFLQLSALAAFPSQNVVRSENRPSTKGLYMHAWDLRDKGADRLMAWTADVGLNQIYLAACYHAGWFVHPHSDRRAFMTEGSVAYFQPDEKLYSRTLLRPQVASFARTTNWLRIAGERLDKFRLQMVSWTLGVHNTTLGLMHPQCTQINAYGDSIPHALSLGHDATREYLKALCRDLAANYPMYGIQLESFGWMGFRHGHHHERDLVGLTQLEQDLLSMCFNPETVKKAELAGIDARKARDCVKAVLDTTFREAPSRPRGHPSTMADLEDRSPDLKAYNAFRKGLEDSLIMELKEQALKGTSCKLLLLTEYQEKFRLIADGFATTAYGQAPEKVLELVKKSMVDVPVNWHGEFPCVIRLGNGVPASPEQLRDIVLAIRQGGSTGPSFYNYSEAPQKMLDWIKGAVEA
jgi:hypothetical protein